MQCGIQAILVKATKKNNNVPGSQVKKYLVRMLAAFMLLSVSAVYAGDALEIGIWPYVSTQTLIAEYHPVQVYLEKRLHRPVLLVTATDQKTFVERTQRKEYSFVFTAPHFARYAELDAGYVPLLRPKRNSFAVFVVHKDSALHDIADLRGKTVTMTGRITMIAMRALQALHDNGLEPGKNVAVRYAVSHNSAVLDVVRGESDAAVTGEIIFDQLPQNMKENLRIIARTGETSPMIYLASPEVPLEEAAGMKQMLLDFVGTPEGQKFIRDMGYQGLRAPTGAEMKRLDPLVADLKKQLRSSR